MDDFDRQVVCIAGLPFDAVDMAGAVAQVREAVAGRRRCFLSTPNLNFLIGCLGDQAFRDSVIHSDLNIADGMPLVWMARLLGLPIRERVAGSGLFEVLRSAQTHSRRMRVYFFGGPEGVAERACQVLSAGKSGLECVGYECPGFGSVEDMSGPDTIALINESSADFLVVALGARKGQAWIEYNRARISVPVISHLGAVVNFVAGTVSRAPQWMQRYGLEWAWRVKEEPALWRRYWLDGKALTRLLLLRIFPYALLRWLRRPHDDADGFFLGLSLQSNGELRLIVEGIAPDDVSVGMRDTLRTATAAKRPLVLDFSGAISLSPTFSGLLLMLKKQQDASELSMRCENVRPALRRYFYWNGIDYLL